MPGTEPRKFETWQQIAGYLQVSVRTAQYWEREKGLPVRRTSRTSRVVAYQGELDRWREVGLEQPRQLTTGTQHGVLQSLPPSSSLTVSLLSGCALYAAAHAAGLMAEVSYSFDRYGATALWAAGLIFLWMLGTSVLAVRLCLNRPGVAAPVAVLLAAATGLYIGICFYLPSHPLTQQTTQAQPANAAYLKGILYILPIAILFQLIPVQLISSMRRQMALGHSETVRALFSGDKLWTAPNKAIYLPLRALWSILLLAVALAIPMTAALFTSLKPSLYQGMFIQWMQVRNVLFFSFALYCLIWYYRALNELKTSAATQAPQPEPHGGGALTPHTGHPESTGARG